jgi:transposase, IS5 family
LSDSAAEEALYEIASMRQFAGLSLAKPIPDETKILNFHRLLEEYKLAAETLSRVGPSPAALTLLLIWLGVETAHATRSKR